MREPLSIIKTPRITEKASALGTLNQYVFKVAVDATKIEIKHAIKVIFQKTAVRVNTMQVAGKLKRERSATAGRRPHWKKAIVTLKDGEKIEFV